MMSTNIRILHNVKSFPKPSDILFSLGSEIEFNHRHLSKWKAQPGIKKADLNIKGQLSNSRNYLTGFIKAVSEFKAFNKGVEFFVKYREGDHHAKLLYVERG